MTDTHTSMANSQNTAQAPRFRTNPVELGIFSVVTVIFLGSLYNLFYNHTGFHPAVLSTMAANPIKAMADIVPTTIHRVRRDLRDCC